MKKKVFSKRLELNKKTVANLDGGQMANAKGGSDEFLCITVPQCTQLATCMYNCTTADPNRICYITCV
jgi:hypothetical protein